MEIEQLVAWFEDLNDLRLHPGYKLRKATSMSYGEYLYAGFSAVPICFSLGSSTTIGQMCSEQIDPPSHIASVVEGELMRNIPQGTIVASASSNSAPLGFAQIQPDCWTCLSWGKIKID